MSSISEEITAPKLNELRANTPPPRFGNQGEAKGEWRDSGIDEEVGDRDGQTDSTAPTICAGNHCELPWPCLLVAP